MGRTVGDRGASYFLGFAESHVPSGLSFVYWDNRIFDLPRSRHTITTSVPIVTRSKPTCVWFLDISRALTTDQHSAIGSACGRKALG